MKRHTSTILAGLLTLSLGVAPLTHTTTTRAAAPDATTAGAATWDVTSGLGDDGATVNLFLPGTIHAYVGDTVRWHVEGSIELHTITFGPAATMQQLAAHVLVPVPQKAGPPLLTLNAQLAAPSGGPTYDGTGFVNSGELLKGQTYSLTFTAPGTYRYYCLIHYPYMSGTVVVAPRPATQQYVIRAGSHDRGEGSAADQFYDTDFAPNELTIHAGDSVTWRLNTAVPHTVTFGPSALLKSLFAQQVIPATGADGKPYLALNPRIMTPVGGPSYTGVGFHNSGLLYPTPGQIVTYTLTFTTPGTYHYICLIHQGMDGYIHVLPAGA